MKTIKLVAAALLLSAGAFNGAFAQSQPATVNQTVTRAHHQKMTTEQRSTMKAERKAKFDKMTPDERKAFKETHRQQREAKLAAMPADKRAKIMERQRTRKTQRKTEKVKS